MIAFFAGYGGYFKMGANTFATQKWTMNKKNRLGETTNSGTAGAATWQKTVSEGDGTIDIVWDAALTPEAGGIDAGDSGTAELQLGQSSLKYSNVPMIIENFTITTDSTTGVILYSANYKLNGVCPDPA